MKKLKIFEANIPSGTDKNINIFEDMTMEQVESELKGEELKTFNSLVRLGDSIDLAYKTVITDRENEAKRNSQDKLPYEG